MAYKSPFTGTRGPVRSSQPKDIVGIDWGNPVTKNLLAAIGFFGNTYWDAVNQKQLPVTTSYGPPISHTATAVGIGIYDPNYGASTTYPSGDATYGYIIAFASFYINSTTLTVTNPLLIAGSGGGGGYTPGTPGSNVGVGWQIYWRNVGGECVVGVALQWNFQTIEVSGVTVGSHTVAVSFSNMGVPQLFLDGKLVAQGTLITSYYYTPGIGLTSFEGPTFSSSGAGVTLLRGSISDKGFNTPQNNLQAREISRNPWQIFAPTKPIIPPTRSISSRSPVSMRQSQILGMSGTPLAISGIISTAGGTKIVRTSQPHYPVGLNRASPVAQGVRSVVGFFGSSLYDACTGKQVDASTQYSTPLTMVPTPYGLGIGDTNNAGGMTTFDAGDGYSAIVSWVTFVVKNTSAYSASRLILCSSSGNGISGSGTPWTMYWLNTAGECKIGVYLSWTNQTVEFAGVSPGLHTFAMAIGYNGAPALYLDGILVATGTTIPSYLFRIALVTDSFENPTFYTSGAGIILCRGIASALGYNDLQNNLQAREISRNPWQIFAPVNTPAWGIK